MKLYDRELTQGTFKTYEIVIPGKHGMVIATANLPDSAKADSGLVIRSTLQIGSQQPDPSKPIVWTNAAETEWTGGGTTVPTVSWSGYAFKARVECSVSKPTFIGWEATATSL